jgi:hypothetical protein
MLSLTEIILVVLSILSWSYTEAQIITVPCDWVCYGSEPPGSGTPISCPAGLQTTIQQNAATPELCICVGSYVPIASTASSEGNVANFKPGIRFNAWYAGQV